MEKPKPRRIPFAGPPPIAAALGLILLLHAPFVTAQQAEPEPAEALPANPVAALLAMPVGPSLATGYAVRVRDENNEPVAGATLVWLPYNTDGYRQRKAQTNQHYPGDALYQTAALALLGTRLALDEAGVTRIPRDVSGRLVAAHGSKFAMAVHNRSSRKKSRSATLTLREPVTVRVRVVTTDGQPAAGVPVGLQIGDKASTTLQRETDEDGTTSLRALGKRGQNTRYVRAAIATREPVRTPLPEAGTDEEAIELRLPACGTVAATFAGRVLPGSTTTYRLSSTGSKQSWLPSQQDAKSAAFAWVEAGLSGEVRCTVEGRRSAIAFESVSANETTNVELPASDKEFLVVRLLLPNGEHVRGGYARTTWRHGNGSETSGTSVNPEGWLVLPIQERYNETTTLSIKAFAGSYSGRLLGSLKPKLGKLEGPDIELGEQRLDAPKLAARGRVVTADGKPVANLRLNAGHAEAVTTDADGMFEMLQTKGSQAVSILQLSGADYYLPTAPYQDFAVDGKSPNEAIEIVVQPAARVLLRAEGVPEVSMHNQLEAQCIPSDDEDAPPLDIPFDLTSKSLRMPAGRWDVVFRHLDEEIHRIEGLTANPGIETHDPRFMFFDWKKFLTIITITVQDEDGKPSNACTVWLRSAGPSYGISPSQGKLACLLPLQGGRVAVDPNNHAEIDLGTINTDQIVRFGAGPRLLVQLAQPPELPAGTTLVAKVGGVEEPLDADGRAELWLSSPDTVRVTLSIARGEHRAALPLPQPLPQVEVPPGGATLAVPVDASFAKALHAASASVR